MNLQVEQLYNNAGARVTRVNSFLTSLKADTLRWKLNQNMPFVYTDDVDEYGNDLLGILEWTFMDTHFDSIVDSFSASDLALRNAKNSISADEGELLEDLDQREYEYFQMPPQNSYTSRSIGNTLLNIRNHFNNQLGSTFDTVIVYRCGDDLEIGSLKTQFGRSVVLYVGPNGFRVRFYVSRGSVAPSDTPAPIRLNNGDILIFNGQVKQHIGLDVDLRDSFVDPIPVTGRFQELPSDNNEPILTGGSYIIVFFNDSESLST